MYILYVSEDTSEEHLSGLINDPILYVKPLFSYQPFVINIAPIVFLAAAAT